MRRRGCQRDNSVSRRPFLLFVFAAFALNFPNLALSQVPNDVWTGQAQCELNLQTQEYALQEIQTWTVVGPPRQENGIVVYPVQWTSQSQGATRRLLGANTLAGQWVGNVQPMEDVLIIAVRPSDNRLVIRRWHLPLQAPGAISGAKQTSTPGGTPNQSQLSLAVYQWPFPTIEDSPTSTTVVGTGTTSVAGNMMPLHTPDGVTGNCKWQFNKGNQQTATKSLNTPLDGNRVTELASGTTTSLIGTAATNIQTGSTPTVQTGQSGSGATNNPPLSGKTAPVLEHPQKASMIPALTQVYPNNAQQGMQNLSIELTGQFTHFDQNTSRVSFSDSGIVNVVSTKVNSPTSLAMVINTVMPRQVNPIPTTSLDITVTTGAEVVRLPSAFAVQAQNVVPQSYNRQVTFSPNSGSQGQQMSVTVMGTNTNFAQGLTEVKFDIGGKSQIAGGTVTVTSPTTATATFTILPAAVVSSFGNLTGLQLVTPVTTNSGTNSVQGIENAGGAFTIAAMPGSSQGSSPPARPAISVSPSSAQQGQQVSMNVTGQNTHFANGSMIVIVTDSFVVPFGPPIVLSPTSATLRFTILPTAKTGNTSFVFVTQTPSNQESVFATFTITSMLPDSYDHGGTGTYLDIYKVGQVQTMDGQLPTGIQDWFQLECDTPACTISLPNLNTQLYPPSSTPVPWLVVADVTGTPGYGAYSPHTIGAQQQTSQITVPSGFYNIRLRVVSQSQSRYRLVITGGSQ